MYSRQSLAKLKWQCRRGTKELDHLLEGYLKNRFNQTSAEEQTLFIELLSFQDSQLLLYLLGDQPPDCRELAQLVTKIRNHSNL